MESSGQWLLPHRGIELYAEKPPVFMWLQLLSHRILGDWNIAFLIPSLLAALFTLWLTHDLARRLWGAKVAKYAALALFCTIQFALMAKRAQIDMVLVAMSTLSLWALCRHLLVEPNRLWLMVAGFATGLGTVTKGVGFLPLLIFVPWLLLRYRGKGPAFDHSGWSWALIPLGFAAGAGVWLVPLGVALAQSHGAELDAYARDILLRQTGTRYVSAWHHVQPSWYYLQVIFTLWLPGSLLLPKLVPAWLHRLRRWDPRQVMLLGWALAVLIFFTASPGKREVYILPALPALCIATAPLLPGLLKRRYSRRVLQLYIATLALASIAAALVLLFRPAALASNLSGRDLDSHAIHALGVWMFALGAAMVFVLDGSFHRPGRATVSASLAIWIVYGIGLMPTLDPFASSSRLMERVDDTIGPDAELGMIDWREQNYLQARRMPVDFGFKEPIEIQWERAFDWMKEAPDRRWILVTDTSLNDCVDEQLVSAIGQSNRNTWLLVPGSAAGARCGEVRATNLSGIQGQKQVPSGTN